MVDNPIHLCGDALCALRRAGLEPAAIRPLFSRGRIGLFVRMKPRVEVDEILTEQVQAVLVAALGQIKVVVVDDSQNAPPADWWHKKQGR
jgi:hypothetical protein